MYKKGGVVIGSGGFGCIFHPELECENGNGNRNDKSKGNYITKLLKKKYAEEEYINILKYKSILKNIPNYSDYFFLKDISICKPKSLTDDDLYNFDNKCFALKKINITKKNINNNLNKLLAIQMPYGGLDVSEFVSLEKYDKYILLNNSLIKLLENGIIPMNQKGIYHCDLKDSNILVSFQKKNKFYTRIIDWGLSIYVTNPRILPEFITNRPFQFNVPFSVVLFNSLFYDMYSMFLKNNPEPSYENIKDFVKIYLQKFVGNHGNGHLPVFVSLLKKINFKKNDLNNNNNNNIPFFLFELSLFSTKIPDEILIYLVEIIVKYTKNGIFELMDYFSNVFLHNVDIWGFCMVYLAIYDELNNNYDKLIAQEHEILNILNELFYILINTSTEKINVDKVIDKCRHLNKYFNEAYEKSIIKKDIKIQSLLSFYQKRQKTYSFPEENRELIKSLSKDHTKRQFFKSINKVSKHMYSSKLFNQKNIGKKTRKNNKKHTKHTKKI